jgi:hypothetical protein
MTPVAGLLNKSSSFCCDQILATLCCPAYVRLNVQHAHHFVLRVDLFCLLLLTVGGCGGSFGHGTLTEGKDSLRLTSSLAL